MEEQNTTQVIATETVAPSAPVIEAAPAPAYASIDDFAKIEIRVGTITHAEYIDGADKLLRLEVDFGEKDTEGNAKKRQILSGIRKWYKPEDLIGKQCPFVTNLAPRTMKGLVSEGMILAARTMTAIEGGEREDLALFHPNLPVTPGVSAS